jgi:RimJ/RimL family protein N-acetyltransferase
MTPAEERPAAPPPMPRPSGPYRTQRLVLRHFAMDDLDAFLAMHGDPEVARYLPYAPLTRDEALARLEVIAGMTAIDDEAQNLRFAAVLADGGQVVGDVSLWSTPNDRWNGAIGYVFHPQFGGQGYATEAAAELLRIGFEEAGLHRITADCDPRNEPSYRLMERLGMRREALFFQSVWEKGRWADELHYAILADEWRAAARLAP